jgi:hypothetical protein
MSEPITLTAFWEGGTAIDWDDQCVHSKIRGAYQRLL